MTDKRDQILMTTRDLIFEHGLQAVSMSQIARQADVGMGTIYNYFPSKEDLVYSLYSGIKATMSDYVLESYDEQQPIVTRFLRLLTSVAYFGVQYPREFRLVEQLAQVPYIQQLAQADANELICCDGAFICRGAKPATAQRSATRSHHAVDLLGRSMHWLRRMRPTCNPVG